MLAGSLSSLTGDVHIERAGTTVPATPGTAVDVRDRIVTGPNSRATITLTDNSNLELDESSSLVIDEQVVGANTRRTKLSLFSGLVRSFVSYTSSPTPNFEVHTPNAIASARGTGYDTSTSSQPPVKMTEEARNKFKGCRRFTEVSVYDGTVEVSNSINPGGGSVQVPKGNKTIVACGFPPFPPSQLTAAGVGAGAASGVAGATSAGLTASLIGAGVVVGGTVGGLAAGGVVGGGSNNNNAKKIASPSE
jgi:hypothetical protein